jgi:nicotinate-nucleotide adenylyltransferase
LICLFGGTFDPIHLGHLHAADVVCRVLGLDEIRLVLSARPSHRGATGASLEHRWAMLQLACAGDARFVADDRELRRARPSYTVETLEAVRAEAPEASLSWVIGSDAYALLPTWHRWQDVLKLANLVVLSRPGPFPALDAVMRRLTEQHRVSSLSGCHSGGILLVDNAMKEIAAADVRAAVAGGRDVSHLLPPPVATYIRTRHLYVP